VDRSSKLILQGLAPNPIPQIFYKDRLCSPITDRSKAMILSKTEYYRQNALKEELDWEGCLGSA
jgi:hypothetical protein